jgi:hypothetical protein
METKVRNSICSKIRSKTCVIPIVEFETKPKRNMETKLNYSCSKFGLNTLCLWTQPNDEISWQKQQQCTYSDWIWGPQLQSFNNHSKTPIPKKRKKKREAIMSFQIYLLCFCLSFHVWPTNVPNNVDLEF